jgi:DNA-binding MarR family transcriptional regulator
LSSSETGSEANPANVTLPPMAATVTTAAPLPRVPAVLARRFLHVCASMIGETLADEEVVQLEYGSLIFIEIEPGMDQRRLADAMGIDASNASLIVDRLESMGLIVRRINQADRRARQLYLTPRGKALWRRLRPKTTAANQRVLAPLLPEQRELFLDLLVRIIEGNPVQPRPGVGRRRREEPRR